MLFARQVLKDGGSFFAWKNTKYDDLIFKAKLRQNRCQVVRMTIAD